MAFTKITGYGISETTDLHVGMVTSTNGVQGVGIFPVELRFIVVLLHH